MKTNIDPSSESGSPQPQRLPANPRRHKVPPEQRKRVVRACNACNVRRVRCSGKQPCQRCSKLSRECEYAAPESDKSALKDEIERLRTRCAALEQAAQIAASTRQIDHARPISRSTVPTFQHVSSEVDEHEGRLLFDPDGNTRYLGETSGATFLDCLKQFMLKLVPLTFQPNSRDGSTFVASIGRYQTCDSRPLPNPKVDPLWLPSPTEMTSMLVELRHHIQDGNGSGSFPSGGIYWWGDLTNLPTSRTSSVATTTTDATHRHLAFHHVCFALASSVDHASFRHSERHTGEAYFERARTLLGNPLDTVRFTLSDVPVLALMGFYLIELNRRDAAYIHVSLAIHIAIIHGAFRSCTDEARIRTYWTLYILDRWLSVLMGRPPTIADEAIRLPLPSDADSMPPSAGLRAHVRLARISGHIVCETFKTAPRHYKPGYLTENIDKALKMLEDWRLQLPRELALSLKDSDIDPACYILHMAQNQLILLTTRPIFLTMADRYISGYRSIEQHEHASHILACSDAAHRNLLLAQSLQSAQKLLQAGLHFVFNAAVILLLHRIIKRAQDSNPLLGDYASTKSSRENLYCPEIYFAIRVFEEESRTGTNYPRDCCRVLHDLNVLVDRYLAQDSGVLGQEDAAPTTQSGTGKSGKSLPSRLLFTESDE